MDKRDVVVVVPIYKAELDRIDRIALAQLHRVLKGYTRVFIAPRSLDIAYGDIVADFKVERFDDSYFRGTLGYSALMLSDTFYARFSNYEYMLIYQTDAFVFKDVLLDFCERGYDYIGAPVERMDVVWHGVGVRVGNGGLSLRKVDSCRRMLRMWEDWGKENPFQDLFLRWEDIFWGYCGRRSDLQFRVPDVSEALTFAVQGNVSHVYERMAKGWRPFGCHGWNQSRCVALLPFIEQSARYSFSASTESHKRQFKQKMIGQMSKNVQLIHIYCLWGFLRHRRYGSLLWRMSEYLQQYPAGHQAWNGLLEEFSFLWRAIRALTDSDSVVKTMMLEAVEEMLYRTSLVEMADSYVLSFLNGVLPQMDHQTLSVRGFRQNIQSQWWEQWDGAAKYAVSRRKRRRQVLVIAEAGEDQDIIESFLRHTCSFSEAVILNTSHCSAETIEIVEKLQQEGLPLEMFQAEQSLAQLVEQARNESDMDLVLGLLATEFLIPAEPGETTRDILEQLDPWQDYQVMIRRYALLHPHDYTDKFLLSRPMIRESETERGGYCILRGKNPGAGEHRLQSLQVAFYPCRKQDADQVIADGETVDITPLVERQVLRYNINDQLKKKKILFLGNSLTLHGQASYWWGTWGMAASEKNKDYVHVFRELLNKKGISSSIEAFNYYLWEVQANDRAETFSLLTQYMGKHPDLVVLQLGENIQDIETLYNDFKELILYIRNQLDDVEIVLIGNFWASDEIESIKEDIAAETGVRYVSVKDLWNDEKYMCGIGTKVYSDNGEWHIVEHGGVARHPGDIGHRELAVRLLTQTSQL